MTALEILRRGADTAFRVWIETGRIEALHLSQRLSDRARKLKAAR